MSTEFAVTYQVRRVVCAMCVCFFFQAEDGIRDLVRSRGLGDVYKRQVVVWELFTGNVPFRGDSPMVTLYKQLHDPPPLDLSLIHI